MNTLLVAVFLIGWTVVDLPLFVAGKLFGIGPDKRYHESLCRCNARR